MAIPIEMPKLSDTMTEGTLVRWHKQPGDQVEIGDVIAEVETDKATMEMEAFDEGVLLELRIREGEKAPIGAVLAVLGEPGESAADAAPTPDAGSHAERPADKPAEQPAAAPPKETPATSAEPAQPASPARPAPVSDAGGRVKASPLAKKLAAAAGVDLTTLSGSGPGGRIVRADVEAATAAAPAAQTAEAATAAPATAPAPAKAPAAAPAPAAIRPVVKEGDERQELSTIRRVIAERLLVAKQTIPHFYLHLEADAAPLMLLRKQVNAQAEQAHGNKYTVNDFVLKAVIEAVKAVPAVNAAFDGDALVRFSRIGLAVAVAVDDGLVTPVVKDAGTKSLLAISREVKDLAARAKERKLRPDEFDGGTITVSNLGAWGIESFDAIINPPQALIVAVGAAVEKPVVRDGQVAPGLRMDLGVSCDHRVVDGALAAEFLGEIRKLVEQPALMLL